MQGYTLFYPLALYCEKCPKMTLSFWKINISLLFCPFASEVLAWINFEPVLFFHVVKGDYGFFAVQKNFNNVIVTCQNLYGYTPHITIVRTTRMKKINKNVNARDDFSCKLQFSQMKMEHLKKRHKSHSLLVHFIS